MTLFTIEAAQTNLSWLIEKALAGEEVVIARGSQPVVRLVPVEQVEPDPFPEQELEEWAE